MAAGEGQEYTCPCWRKSETDAMAEEQGVSARRGAARRAAREREADGRRDAQEYEVTFAGEEEKHRFLV
jgi:hypothetical protein